MNITNNENINSLFVNYFCKFIYFISELQSFLIKNYVYLTKNSYYIFLINKLNEFMKYYTNNDETLEIIKNGKIINKYLIKNLGFKSFNSLDNFDFLILKKKYKNQYYNKIYFYEDISDNISDNISEDINISTIKFLNLQINDNLIIKLNNKDFNFYLVNNKITKEFIIYYLLNIKKMDINQLNSEFNKLILNIIDENVNILTLDLDKYYILIDKTSYKIIDIKS